MMALVDLSKIDCGTDLSCVQDLDPNMLEVSGLLRCLGEALARRLMTPRGGLLDDPNYGYDVAQSLNDDLDAADIAQIAARIDAEFLKDERVHDSRTLVVFAGGALTITSTVTTAAGPFPLVIGVSDVGVELLKVGP